MKRKIIVAATIVALATLGNDAFAAESKEPIQPIKSMCGQTRLIVANNSKSSESDPIDSCDPIDS